MKPVIAALLILILLVLAINSQVGATTPECPEGSYNIGISKTDEPLCKIIPTGCPYGDSIPLEQCDKYDGDCTGQETAGRCSGNKWNDTQPEQSTLPTENPVPDTYLPEFKGK